MNLNEKFHEDMLAIYTLTGEATNGAYWPRRFLQAVKNHGGLAWAKKALSKTDDSQDGFKRLIEYGIVHLSVEELVLKSKYSTLFTEKELKEARRRINTIPPYARRSKIKPEHNFAGEIKDDSIYAEGATKKVIVNSKERNPAARKACLEKHGYRCKVCNMDFEKVYGKIGKGFIHVHHLKPLAGTFGEYEIDPVKDLVPVCPNCHAMLHTKEPPLSVNKLKSRIK